jgi:4-amino-4-deoxy-L-arabinose transferase-like glycosyltransferase
MSRATIAILAVVTVLGGLWRVLSFGYNVWPHGDVVIDAAIAESVAWHGRLLVPIVDVRYYPIDQFGFGYPPDQHPPVWPLLGAALTGLVGDGYTALKLVSLLVGIVVVPLTYLALRRWVGNGPALLASGLVAASYPLVDFSGNGSLWVLLAAFYLVWLWALPGDRRQETGDRRGIGTIWPISGGRRWALLGVVMGLAYLTNYPAVVLPVALVGVHLLRYGRDSFRPAALKGPVLSAIVMFVVVLPWLVFNVVQFGSPIWSQPFQRTLAGGSRQVEYVLLGDEVVKRNLPAPPNRLVALREKAFDLYGNVGFVMKQSLVLTPVLGGLFAVGLLLLVPWPGRPHPQPLPTAVERGASNLSPPLYRNGEGGGGWGLSHEPLPVAVLALVHLALIVWWPTTKFRYLVPLLPLVIALGGWCLWQIGPAAVRNRLAIVVAGLCLFTNAWTMLSIPSHTYYYDGGLVADNFGQQGERLFVGDARQYKAAADAIIARGPGTILGDHIMSPLTRMPLVINSTVYPPEIVQHLVHKYQIRYIVAERSHADDYAFLGTSPIWSGDRFVVLEVDRSQ